MVRKKTVSVVIPVFNEEKTVANVVRAVLTSEIVSEIICVNDGSVDRSLEILKGFGDKIRLINFGNNQGKGAALAAGVRIAGSEIIVFFDADLIGLKKEHIVKLTRPLSANQSSFTLGRLADFPLIPVLFSGQRAYWKKDLNPYLRKIAQTRFGVEVFLNYVFREEKRKIVALKGLNYLRKQKKISSEKVAEAYLDMFKEIFQVMVDIEKSRFKKVNIKLEEEVSFEELFIKLGKVFEDKDFSRKLRRYFSFLKNYRLL